MSSAFFTPGFYLAFALFAHFQRESKVFIDGHVRKQRIILKHHAYTAMVRGDIVDRGFVEINLAVSGGFEPRQHHQAGGFAGTGRAQHGEEFTARDIQIQIFYDK